MEETSLRLKNRKLLLDLKAWNIRTAEEGAISFASSLINLSQYLFLSSSLSLESPEFNIPLAKSLLL
jgi:hypothetical protein